MWQVKFWIYGPFARFNGPDLLVLMFRWKWTAQLWVWLHKAESEDGRQWTQWEISKYDNDE